MRRTTSKAAVGSKRYESSSQEAAGASLTVCYHGEAARQASSIKSKTRSLESVGINTISTARRYCGGRADGGQGGKRHDPTILQSYNPTMLAPSGEGSDRRNEGSA